MQKDPQNTLLIDIHAHIGKKDLFENIPWMHDVDALRRQQEEAGIDISVLSTPLIDMPWEKGEKVCLDLIKEWNDFAISIVQKSGGCFLALAATNPFANDNYLKEVERVIKQGGMKGICVNSSVRGEYLDSTRAFPLFELAIELDVPILVHPPSHFRLAWPAPPTLSPVTTSINSFAPMLRMPPVLPPPSSTFCKVALARSPSSSVVLRRVFSPFFRTVMWQHFGPRRIQTGRNAP